MTDINLKDIKNKDARVSEIFLSYQGEGSLMGSRQLFIRFFGCNLNCVFCDTLFENYKSFSKESLMSKLLDFEDNYNELSLTGGEPLIYADFLRSFLVLFKRYINKRVYLETNGTLVEELKKIIGYIDIIAMDFKLPSSAGQGELWARHEEFIKLALSKELIVKAVVTDSTTMDDIKVMAGILSALKKDFTVVLQSVTPENDSVKEPDNEMVSYFKGYLAKHSGKKICIMGQAHKYLGIK